MSLKDALTSLQGQGSDTRKADIPDGWRPRMELDSTTGGFFVSAPRTAGDLPDAVAMFADFDLDPSAWRVTSVRKSRWQRYDGEWLESARVNVVPADAVRAMDDSDLDQFVTAVAKWRPNTRQKAHTGNLAGVFCIGDTQWGKDAGDGSEGTVRRVMAGLDASLIRHRELVKAGRDIGTVCLPQLGDCIEGHTSQSGKVIGRSDLTITQQVRLGRRVLMNWVKAFAPLAETVIVPVVPGNHDQTTRFVITDPVDSWQIEIAAAVQDACAENPALAHVTFRYPDRDNGSLTVNLNGTMVGFIHGHQTKNVPNWWAAQAQGKTPVGAADVLVSAHYHHFIAQQVGPRLWLQTPAMDGGSPWFRDGYGLESPTGIVSFVVGDGYDPRRDLAVVGGEYREQN